MKFGSMYAGIWERSRLVRLGAILSAMGTMIRLGASKPGSGKCGPAWITILAGVPEHPPYLISLLWPGISLASGLTYCLAWFTAMAA